ncbi:MAG: type IX secretion system sortase PorU [Cytophagaceae bacterium]|nr:type IX secretion system sortase PorU [Cytophagaceae bacterium]
MILSRVKNPSIILLLLLCVVGFPAFSQTGNFSSIEWRQPRKYFDSTGKEITVFHFDRAVYQKNNPALPAYLLMVSGIAENFKITNAAYAPFTAEEQKIIPPFLNSDLQTYQEVQYQNGKPVTLVYLYPYKISSGIVTEKIISFEYTYEKGLASAPAKSSKGLKLAAFAGFSVLATGDWYKISVNKSGIFKIDYNFLNSIGINPSTIDPREIKIYGNGGGMLPQINASFRYDDLVENAIFVQGESDGVFDTGDYILFYSNGPDTCWKYDAGQGIYLHSKNLYSDYAYYFITVSPGTGTRVVDQASVGGATQTITSFDERIFHEIDKQNIVISGREWYGEVFDFTTEQTFSYPAPGITPNTTLKVNSYVMGRSLYPSSFTVSINNQLLGTQNLGAISSYIYAIKGTENKTLFSINTNSISGSSLTLKYTYNKGASSAAIGHLNYFTINFQRDLKLYGNETSFRSVTSTTQSISDFVVDNYIPELLIWDISDPLHPKNQLYNVSGTQATFGANTTTLKEFVAFNNTASFSSPVYVGRVTNQNLHSITTPNLPDLVIVCPSAFLNAANRLAAFRTTNDNLDVEIATLDQIYNEFSSGAQDITAIRDFMKMLYDRKTPTDSVRYLLLLGDASYDYKNRISGNTNLVPIYESRQSLHPVDSYSSDDYFAFLDNSEGNWSEIAMQNYLMDIGVGRLPVKSISEAEDAINKLIHYSGSQKCLGKWRNKVSFVADDGDYNLHLLDADDLSDMIETTHKKYNVNKIFLDAYTQVPGPGGESSPDAKNAITTAVEKGTLILNYTGHGGEIGWTQEAILDIPQINNWENYNNLPLFITATCEFGRYDDPSQISGAEYSFLSNKGGTIALITSTRPVYSNSNFDLNQAIYKYIFTPVSGSMPRMGDVMRKTKNDPQSLANGINNRNYALLGDPSMMLAYPKENIVVTKINGNPVSLTDTIKALGTVTLEGEVRDGLGAKINDFSGTASITVYDKQSVIQTLGSHGSSKTTFNLRNNFIYEGLATVTNGSFTVTFVVPKDISYLFDKGKISVYAKKDGYILDASGYNNDIIIGGTDTNFVADNTPPQIKLFMNDETFVFGGLTSANSLFLAKVADDNGINIAGQGIGHEITAVLDNTTEVIVLNEYYTAKKDNYKEGRVEYPFKGLSTGNHSIRFKAWDTHNNSSEAYLEFVVANEEKIALDHVLNYPNPFSTHTTFHFDHNRAGDDLDVMVQIYTISGKLIKTLDGTYFGSNTHFSDLVWDGRDDFGDKLGKGVYVYKVNVRSLRDGSRVFKYQKLVILN